MCIRDRARALQIYCIEATKPDMVVALQRERELEHLLKQLKALEVRVQELDRVEGELALGESFALGYPRAGRGEKKSQSYFPHP